MARFLHLMISEACLDLSAIRAERVEIENTERTGSNMRVMAGLVLLLSIMAAFALPGTAIAKPAGDGAFLIESVDSVAELVNQVEESRLLVLRYAKHYRVDPSAVLSYFRNELSIAKIEDTQDLGVYRRKGNSEIELITKTFKAGTRVFVNSKGIPVLEMGTGNPMSDSVSGVPKLPSKPETLAQAEPGATTQTPAEAAAVQTPVPAELPTTVPGNVTSPLADQVAAAVTTEPETAVLASGPIETVAKAASGGGTRIAGWLLPAAGIAGAALIGAGGSSSPDGDGLDPIPEPGGMLALGTGLISLAGFAYRRNRMR